MTTVTTLGELTGDYVLDTARTRIGFVARHRLSTRVRGRFDEFEGTARLDGGDPSKSSVRLTIRAGSVRTGNRQRDEQLCRTFLEVDEHPAITFASTRVERRGDDGFAVTGDLTVRGVCRPVTVEFTLTGAEDGLRVAFAGGATIDRNDWGVNWNALTRVMVGPKVVLELDAAVVRRA
ncbi:YceI family protein [Actinomadura opuntiae]|uniref:YceI family protein n=1 Tax=Actinomadura sp. OS1-43 TaxID=604315 RepID=UPI00255AD639|nr:YceI family protein [Actinomadura sp. OS1-43]MDL4815528.1 YceI family protein [Actinomadura sp. OS1-43]